MADPINSEQAQAIVSGQVDTVLDHLRHNRTTEIEVRELQEASRRSLTDHATAKALR